ncbi:hypothetical protein JHK82_043606 [Glycine max]|nr:hypothetical protein JHK86_043493 [Glycine max]KAG5106636.1 hypothetical protein JHK82_043606 [Glycine max]KAG5117565.1 hypothetical protein JHK84_043678 [Glycine max]
MGVMRSMQDWQNLKLILHEAIKEKKGHHEEVISILGTRSKTQLVATFNRFKDENGSSISKETSDDFNKAVNVAIHCINDHKYYEKVLRNAIKGVGTDEDGLTRVFVTRITEKDLKDIKELYYKKNSGHLEDAVAKEISGYYKKFLLTLLGKEG